MLKKLIKLSAIFLKLPYSVLKYIYKSGKYQNGQNIAFDYTNTSYLVFYKPFIEYFAKKKYNIIFFGNAHPEYECYFEYTQFIFWSNLVIISADKHRFFKRKNHSIIQIFHGIASFGSIWDKGFLIRNNAIFLTSQFQRNQLDNSPFKELIHKHAIRVYDVGYHKLDTLFNNYSEKSAKKLFYGPTWHVEFSSIFDWVVPIFEVCSDLKIDLIIKLHPYLYSKNKVASGGIKWEQKLKEVGLKFNVNLEILPVNCGPERLSQAFSDTNIFVTDVSSIGHEFVLTTGGPIVYLGNKIKVPIGADPELFKDYPEYRVRGLIGPIVHTKETFRHQVINLSNANPFNSNIKEYRKSFTYNLGSATVTGIEAIIKEFELLN